jgi:hypothetical protein
MEVQLSDSAEVRTAFADESLTVGASVSGLTLSVFDPGEISEADRADFTVKVDAISWRVTGLDPSATVGHLQAAGSHFTIYGNANLKRLKMIRVTGDATVQVTYYRRGDS